MYEGKELGRAIREALRLMGMTQREIADEFGIEQASVSGWCTTGRISKAKLAHLMDMAAAKGIGPLHWGLKPGTPTQNLSPHALRLAQLFDALPASQKPRAYALLQQMLKPEPIAELPPLPVEPAQTPPPLPSPKPRPVRTR